MNGVLNKKILVIEDDESTRYLLGLFLQKFPINALYADSVYEGKRLLRQHDVDLVVCDYNLGDGFGIELLAHLRDTKSEIPFILYTSEEFSRIPHTSYLKFTHVQKPNVDTLMDEVERQLQK